MTRSLAATFTANRDALLQEAVGWVIDCWGIDAADCLVDESDVIAVLEREYAGGLFGFVRDQQY
jgi:hypothetical protein